MPAGPPACPPACRGAPDLTLYLSLSVLTGWHQARLADPALAVTLLLPDDNAIRQHLEQQVGNFSGSRTRRERGRVATSQQPSEPSIE